MVLRQILQCFFLIGEELSFKAWFGSAFKINKPKGNASHFLSNKNQIYCNAIYEQLKSTQMSSSRHLYKPPSYSAIWQYTI